MYIAIGGIDGSGKSTLQRMLIDHLALQGRDVVGFAEPYHGFVKELLETTTDPWTDVLLFALDRWLLRPKIADWLSQGKVLVSSRSIYCSVAYQGAQGIEWEDTLKANNWKWLHLPDVFLILDADPQVAYSRCSKKEKFEREDFLDTVREEYLKIYEKAEMFPGRMVLIDANKTIDDVFKKILSFLESVPF